ncbi:MAG: serine/threonine-protein kinase [Planctomycetota bacterium JB042]
MNEWDRVQELFAEVAELAPAERAERLRERTGGDARIARRVEALLAADTLPVDALDDGAAALLARLSDTPRPEALIGLTFDAYRIDDRISSGGMAHVYRATRRVGGAERRIALKVLRPGLDGAAFLERFERERATLAALEHENVVTFLDAGALPDGRPFLVMEYVDGEPITVWSRGVSRDDVLERFAEVLAAVQHAHQRLVVHRDLKPSNVLVTPNGTPKLLDFGVAAVLEEDGGDAAGGGPLTPAYASPEQVRGDPVTTGSDVFALGLLLHELVAGALPADGPSGREVTVRGDLGAVIRKAIATEPARRYRSADRFADDVRRVLAHEPVSARPATWTYRSARFARRHRGALATGAALVVAVATGWIGAVLDLRLARADASTGWGAHAEAKAAARVFEAWIARAASGDPALAEDAAAHLERALAENLATHPEAETLVRLALADLYLSRAEAGDVERARLHAERAAELARTTRGVGRAERERAAALVERVIRVDRAR